MIENKYDLITRQIQELLGSQGEFTFLSCANTFINKDYHLFNSVI